MTCCCDDWDVYDGWAECEAHPSSGPDEYTAFYVSEDYPIGTWSVYSERYRRDKDEYPIDNTQRIMRAGLATEHEADLFATMLYQAPVIQEEP